MVVVGDDIVVDAITSDQSHQFSAAAVVVSMEFLGPPLTALVVKSHEAPEARGYHDDVV